MENRVPANPPMREVVLYWSEDNGPATLSLVNLAEISLIRWYAVREGVWHVISDKVKVLYPWNAIISFRVGA